MKKWLLFFLVGVMFIPGIGLAKELSGELIIFNAGSFAVPFQDMVTAFNQKYPGVKVLREAAGSRECARKVSDLKRECDVVASADYTVINQLLIPEYADWNILFTSNEMSIMYHKESRYADQINADNWPRILLQEGVEYGHSDPNADPCGYRSLLVWKLAEEHYKIPNLYEKLSIKCPPNNIRSKETDLIAQLEAGELDYIFIYRSVSEQHKMPYVVLPEQINLKSAKYADFYRTASVKVTGKAPGEWIEKKGEPMLYGITIIKNAPHREAAEAFVEFVISAEGQKIMAQNGQPVILPPVITGDKSSLPAAFRQ
jgi:molybdate/tungstate transport system substrate-binding protein